MSKKPKHILTELWRERFKVVVNMSIERILWQDVMYIYKKTRTQKNHSSQLILE